MGKGAKVNKSVPEEEAGARSPGIGKRLLYGLGVVFCLLILFILKAFAPATPWVFFGFLAFMLIAINVIAVVFWLRSRKTD